MCVESQTFEINRSMGKNYKLKKRILLNIMMCGGFFCDSIPLCTNVLKLSDTPQIK